MTATKQVKPATPITDDAQKMFVMAREDGAADDQYFVPVSVARRLESDRRKLVEALRRVLTTSKHGTTNDRDVATGYAHDVLRELGEG